MRKEINQFKCGNETFIQEIETLPNGNKKIISRMIRGVLTEKYDDIKLRILMGKKVLDKREFFELIIGDRFKKKDYVMELYDDYMQARHCKSIDELMYYSTWAKHFIPNTFYKWHDRSLENMRCCQWMFFDFELRKSTGQSFIPAEVYEIFKQTVGFAPTIIKQSKTPGNYHVGLKHTTLNGSTESLYLFKRIQQKIAEIIGTDLGAIGANHSFSLPKKNQKVYFFGDNTIDFNDLKKWWINKLKEENQKVVYTPKTGSKIASLTEHKVWTHKAVTALINHEYDGSRNEAGFTLALMFYAMGKSVKECERFMFNEWYPLVPQHGKPYRLSELKASVRSAYSEKYAGPSKEKIEALTGIEFNLRIYKGQYVREKLHNKKENQQAIINYFREHDGSVEMTRKELVEDICRTQESPLGKSFAFDSINRNLDKLKKDGTVEWEIKRGKGSAPAVFRLNDGIQETKTIIEEDYKVYVYGKVVNLN
jgi:hypothetical protein